MDACLWSKWLPWVAEVTLLMTMRSIAETPLNLNEKLEA